MIKRNWELNSLPQFVKEQKLANKPFFVNKKRLSDEIDLEVYDKAETLVNCVYMLYENKLEGIDKAINASVENKDGVNIIKNVNLENQVKKDYEFIKTLYKNYNDIVIFGFDFNKELNNYLHHIRYSLTEDKPLNKLADYKKIKAINEFVGCCLKTIYYLSLIEDNHNTTVKNINNDNLEEGLKEITLNKEDYLYYNTLKRVKYYWGCIASPLLRAYEGNYHLKVTNKKLEEFVTKGNSEAVYDYALNSLSNTKKEIRQKENELYKKQKEEKNFNEEPQLI